MAKVLTDLFSIFEFENISDSKFKESFIGDFSPHFSLIENLILCEKVVVEKNGVSHYDLESVCDSVSDGFDFIEDKRLYKKFGPSDTLKIGEQISERGLIYADVAKDNEIYYSPHPIREKLLAKKIATYVNNTAEQVINHVDQKITESKSGEIANINIAIPPVIEHSLYFSKAQGITITESISEIRGSKNAETFRKYINDLDEEIRDLSPRKKVAAYQPLFRDIDRLCNAWSEDMNAEVKFRKRKINLTKIPIIGSVFGAIGLPEIEIKDRILFPSKPHLLFINDLYKS